LGTLAAMAQIAASVRLNRRPRPLPTLLATLLGGAMFVGGPVPPALAHSGPPYRVLPPTAAGPYTVAIWADPDVGAGTIYVMVEPAGAATGGASEVSVAVRPADEHIAEAVYPARLDPVAGSADRFVANVPFDAEGEWALRVMLHGAAGDGELATALQATPAEGPQAWETWLYIFPFALLGGALAWGLWRSRRERVDVAAEGG